MFTDHNDIMTIAQVFNVRETARKLVQYFNFMMLFCMTRGRVCHENT